jgi:hypothetical protein
MPTPWKWYKWALISLLLTTSLRFSVARAQDSRGDPSPERQPPGLELEEVLKQLEENLNEYRHSVPDLSCKEHVVSSMEGRRLHKVTVSDSTFRLRKLRNEDGLVEFEESRVLRAVDGKVPANDSDTLSGPAVLSGVFSDGLQVVSSEFRGCYQYTMHRAREGHAHEMLLVDFSDLPKDKRAVECPPFEGTRGQAAIDPVSMHVLQLEKTTPDPNHPLGRTATWKWKVDYAPVQLQGETFWMPRAIHSMSRTDDGMYEWNFEGTYKDYHLFHVESRIMPVTP